MKLFKLLLVGCFSIALFASCNSKPEPNVPSDAQDIYGQYDGTLTTNGGEPLSTTTTVDDYEIRILKFPFHSLVRAAVPMQDVDKALASLPKEIAFTMPFKAAKMSDGTVVVTLLLNGQLSIPVAINGVQHYIFVTFQQTTDGVLPTGNYDYNSKQLKLEFRATTVSYDDVKIEGFTPRTYRFVSERKSAVEK